MKRAALTALLSAALGAAAEDAPRNCVLASEVCAESGDRVVDGVVVSRDCWRWERTYACDAPSPDADRCRPGRIPDFCRVTGSACADEDADGVCRTETASLLCTDKPEGPGITPEAPRIKVEYSTSGAPSVDPSSGCRITQSTCLEEGARRIPVENLAGEWTEAEACWRRAVVVSCPDASAAESCAKLESAGCIPKGSPVCEVEDASGVCSRWSAVYVCTGDVPEGGDLVPGDPVERPGEGVEDDSECRAKVDDAEGRGLACALLEKVCDEADASGQGCTRWSARYECAIEEADACRALESLAQEGVCRVEGETVCEAEDPAGNCIRRRFVYRCGSELGSEPPEAADYVDRIESGVERPADTCAGHVSNEECRETSSVCIEGPEVRIIDGKPVYRDCWMRERVFTCPTSAEDDCAKIEADARCRLVETRCPEGGRECARPVKVYECRTPEETISAGEVCEGEACIAGVCAPVDDAPDRDFAGAVVSAEIGREASLYGDLSGNEFFAGEVLSCRDRKGAPSCCRSDAVPGTSNSAFSLYLDFGVAAGWEAVKYVGSPYVYDLLSYSDRTSWLLTAIYGNAPSGVYEPNFSFWGVSVAWTESGGFAFEFSPAGFAAAAAMHFYQNYRTCRAEEQKLAMARGERLCRFVGTECEEKVPGLGCITRAHRYVCFNSRLARIIHEEGRAQLNRSWGTADAPDARGFTLEEMERLDFTIMDLREFAADVVLEAQKGGSADLDTVLARTEERLNEILEGKLAHYSKVGTPTGVSRTDARFRSDPLAHPEWGPYSSAQPRGRRPASRLSENR